MIKLIKNSTSSFSIQMDAEGINESLEYLKNVNEERNGYLKIMYWGGEIKLQIELNMNIDEIRISKDIVVI